MDSKIEVVSKFYSSERILKETKEEQSYTKGLKIWEKEVITKYFAQKQTVLDIGCGTGREAFCLHDRGFSVTGTDISADRIETAKQLALESNRNIAFLLTDWLNLPFECNSFDVVVIWAQTFGLFYSDENQQHILKECYRVLKDNGIISFSGHDKEYLDANYPQYLDGKKFFAYADTDCYWEIFTIDEMKEKAEKAGFTVIKCQRGNIYREEDGTVLHCECRK